MTLGAAAADSSRRVHRIHLAVGQKPEEWAKEWSVMAPTPHGTRVDRLPNLPHARGADGPCVLEKCDARILIRDIAGVKQRSDCRVWRKNQFLVKDLMYLAATG